MDDIWSTVLEQLEKKLSAKNFETWIKPIHVKEIDQHKIRLEVPSKFFRDWITEHYLSTIETSLKGIYPELVNVAITVNSSLQDTGTHDHPNTPRKAAKTSTLITKYTFDNFIVGSSNQLAHAACLAVATQPGENYNPLFIYGGVGLGKTHLVNAIGHRIRERGDNQRVIYLTSEAFMNELIGSLRRDRMDEFKNRFRTIDVLIVDDIQFLAGKERTQEEFFHTFNSLHENRKQIVITSDKFPKEIPDLEDRLRNRFEWGLIADIQPPDLETRIAILGKKAEAEGIDLPESVAIFLGTHIRSNVRELEGSLTRLGAFSSLTKNDITIELAQEVLQNTLSQTAKKVTIENIQKTICEHFNIKITELKSKSRAKSVALPRQVAMYLCRKYTNTSFPVIGYKFGGRDHSTVIHASKIIEQRIRDDPSMQATVERLERDLKS